MNQDPELNPDKRDGKPVDPFSFDLFEVGLLAICLALVVAALVMSAST